jgi:DNA repair exonuclease SbcCD ATPase subunit
MFILLPGILIAVAFALLLAALFAGVVIAALRKAPALFGLLLAFMGAAAALAFAGLRRQSQTQARPATGHAQPNQRRQTDERREADDVRRLAEEIGDLLKTSPLSQQQKSDLRAQIKQVPENTSHALAKLNRLRRLKDIAHHQADSDYAAEVMRELEAMEAQVHAQLRQMRYTLLDLSVALMKVDVSRGDGSLDRLIARLSETNQRLDDLADGYADVRAERAHTYSS